MMWECKDPSTDRVIAVHRDLDRAVRLDYILWEDELFTLNVTKEQMIDLLDILL